MAPSLLVSCGVGAAIPAGLILMGVDWWLRRRGEDGLLREWVQQAFGVMLKTIGLWVFGGQWHLLQRATAMVEREDYWKAIVLLAAFVLYPWARAAFRMGLQLVAAAASVSRWWGW